MSQCLCQSSSVSQSLDANWMRNPLMRGSDDRTRWTWKGSRLVSCVPSAILPDMRSSYGYCVIAEILPCSRSSLHELWCSSSPQHNCLVISSLMITDWTLNMSRVRYYNAVRHLHATATLKQLHDVMFLISSRVRSEHGLQDQLQTYFTFKVRCVFAIVSWVGAFCLKYISSRSYVWFWSKCTLQWLPFPATLMT